MQNKVDHKTDILQEGLKDMPNSMQIFSLSMRALYAEKAVGSSTEVSQKFRRLRDDTRNDAMVYLTYILPITTKLVTSIIDYFDNYDALSFGEWCEMLKDILKETTAHKELSKTVLTMYESMIVPLKKRQDEARIIMREFEDLQVKFETQKQALEKMAGVKHCFAFVLGWIPVVNELVASRLRY